jgi:tetratricopeptide (TPR) repeat protein
VLRFENAREPGLEEVAKVFEGLRAAIGVIRTLFSIGIVSRFDDLDGLDFQLPPKLGYFEHHRLVVRWMIRLAGTLQEKLEASGKLWPPFYRDELVWLYNECGVFSLTQGEIYDAHALLGMAAAINRRIEGAENGPMGRRLALNRCICQIERGRLDDAEEGFARIFASQREELLLREVARGYLGLVHHIKGRLDVAEQLYEEAIGALVAIDRFRPVSILQRHYGDMLRLVGRFGDAERVYRSAERAATAGGNMDLVHMAQVAMARLRFAQGIVDESTRRLLEEATAYANTMELPRLKAESLFARGEALLHSGETTLAGDFAVRALRIATLNGLALRKAAYSELMVRIYRARGDDHAADVLLAKTIKAARGQGYNVLMNRIASTPHGAARPARAAPAPPAAAGSTGGAGPQSGSAKAHRG